MGSGPAIWVTHLELQLLLALAGREHPAAAPEERVGGDLELDLQPERAQQLDRAVAPLIAPALDDLGLADAHDLALMEHLQPRRISGGLVAEDVGAAGVDRHAPRLQRAAGGDRRIDRIARGGRQHEVGHVLELAPVLVAAGALVLLGACASVPSNEKMLPARCGNDFR